MERLWQYPLLILGGGEVDKGAFEIMGGALDPCDEAVGRELEIFGKIPERDVRRMEIANVRFFREQGRK